MDGSAADGKGEGQGQGGSAQAAQELRSEVVFMLTSGTSSLPAFQGLVPVTLPADAGQRPCLPACLLSGVSNLSLVSAACWEFVK